MRFLIALLFAANAFAIPQLVNYQGSLTNLGGTPLDTTVSITFKFYNGSGGGATLLWTEVHPTVVVNDGLFDRTLGSITALNNSVFNNTEVWLGVTVGSNTEMIPRERVTSVGYSYRVGTVDGAGGGTVSGELTVGSNNTNQGFRSYVFGDSNFAAADFVTVAGGRGNGSDSNYGFVGGGYHNSVNNNYGVVSGGEDNHVDGLHSVIGGGENNSAQGSNATIGGGGNNSASENHNTIGGGLANSTSNLYATVAGGSSNDATGNSSTIGGGSVNLASAQWTTIAGGYSGIASGSQATVSGGGNNNARGASSFVGGGGSFTEADSNSARAIASAIVGGRQQDITSSAPFSFIGGGFNNFANDSAIAIGGGRNNGANGKYAAIAGGDDNAANGDWSTVAGGFNNGVVSSAPYAFIGGGFENTASGDSGITICGGNNNEATGKYAAIGGGQNNIASGAYSMVPGGLNCTAGGDYSFAAGRNVTFNSDADGSFVWGDNTTTDTLVASSPNRVYMRATNGYRLYTNADLTSGVFMSAGANSWSPLSDSTMKRNRRDVDTKIILEKVNSMPIQQWSYKSQDESIEHIGPMAQDFWRLFHLGDDSLRINQLDPDGIVLAAIQELAKQNDELREELTRQAARYETQSAEITKLKTLVNQSIQLGQK